jgi:hypothetical protein
MDDYEPMTRRGNGFNDRKRLLKITSYVSVLNATIAVPCRRPPPYDVMVKQNNKIMGSKIPCHTTSLASFLPASS